MKSSPHKQSAKTWLSKSRDECNPVISVLQFLQLSIKLIEKNAEPLKRASCSSVESVYHDAEHDSDEESVVESAIPNVRTFVRAEAPQDLTSHADLTHSRGLQIEMFVEATVFCGGGILKGELSLRHNPNARKNKNTQVVSVQLDLLGVECSLKFTSSSLLFTTDQDSC